MCVCVCGNEWVGNDERVVSGKWEGGDEWEDG